jgi:hypothetical protein
MDPNCIGGSWKLGDFEKIKGGQATGSSRTGVVFTPEMSAALTLSSQACQFVRHVLMVGNAHA